MLSRKIPAYCLLILIFLLGSDVFGQIRSGSGIGTGDTEQSRKAKIIAKPEPKFFKDQSINLEGAIVLTAILGANGKVSDVKFVRVVPGDLPKDWIEKIKKSSIDAAKKIKFEPAMRNGKPVSVKVQLEYNFREKPINVQPDPILIPPELRKPEVNID